MEILNYGNINKIHEKRQKTISMVDASTKLIKAKLLFFYTIKGVLIGSSAFHSKTFIAVELHSMTLTAFIFIEVYS